MHPGLRGISNMDVQLKASHRWNHVPIHAQGQSEANMVRFVLISKH